MVVEAIALSPILAHRMRLLLLSSSVVHGYGFLERFDAEIRAHLADVDTIAFVPFSQHDHAGYTARVRKRFAEINIGVEQVHGPKEIESAAAIFIGGGNSFRLLKELYDRALLDPIRARIRGGVPYLGSSAGTNVATPSIRTTNDMPIVFPPSFDALGVFPYQINPHYLDADPTSTHKGETREERIREFHEENDTPVIGLREASALSVSADRITLLGDLTARLFRRGVEPIELEPGEILEGA
jgi:dipeptidase E